MDINYGPTDPLGARNSRAARRIGKTIFEAHRRHRYCQAEDFLWSRLF